MLNMVQRNGDEKACHSRIVGEVAQHEGAPADHKVEGLDQLATPGHLPVMGAIAESRKILVGLGHPDYWFVGDGLYKQAAE